jgi:CDP-6-deoxy-D-xylo-4-hexulose-3-dehydrase
MVLGNAKLTKIVKSFRDWGRDCWCPTGHDNTCGKRFEWELGELPSGYDHKYIYSEIGYNLKSTDLQGALGLSQISRIQEFTDIRKRNFHQLRMLLDDLEEFFIMPMPTKGSSPSWFGFPLTIRTHAPFGLSAIEAFMANRKIGTRRLFAGNYLSQPLFVDYKNEGQHQILRGLPNTDIITSNTFWIGTWPGLEAKQIEYMAENIHDFVRQF